MSDWPSTYVLIHGGFELQCVGVDGAMTVTLKRCLEDSKAFMSHGIFLAEGAYKKLSRQHIQALNMHFHNEGR